MPSASVPNGGGVDVGRAHGRVVQEEEAVGVDPAGLGLRITERVTPDDGVVAHRRVNDRRGRAVGQVDAAGVRLLFLLRRPALEPVRLQQPFDDEGI